MIFRILAPVSARSLPRALDGLRDVAALAKMRITLMVIFTASVGYSLAQPAAGAARPFSMLGGLLLVVAGANALNQWLERDVDARMQRTRSRPLPSGRMAPGAALAVGLIWSFSGLAVLLTLVNTTAAWLAALGLISYVLVYTPMKRVSPVALLVGAVPGAISTLVGWSAATESVGALGLALFAILFFWQVPHFLAITLFRRAEYERAGLRVLPVVRGEAFTERAIVFYTVLLAICAIAPVFLDNPTVTIGPLYAAVAILLNAGFLAAVLAQRRWDSRVAWARGVFLYSLIYLPALLGALVLDALFV